MSLQTVSTSAASSSSVHGSDPLTTIIACWIQGALQLSEVCALTGLSEADLDLVTADQAFVARVNRIRALPQFGPFVARLKAKRGIAPAVERLAEIVQDPDSSAAAITKAAELLYSLSQMRAEDGLRDQNTRSKRVKISINWGGQVQTLVDTGSDAPSEIDELS
jgi:hypothetical protein